MKIFNSKLTAKITANVSLLVLLFFLSVISDATGSFAATRYVSTTGTTTDCTVMQNSSTPAGLIRNAYNCSNAGDIVIVKKGTYTETSTDYGILRLQRSGTSSSPITLKSEVRWGAVLDGQGSTAFNDCIYFDGADYNIVQGFEMKRCPNGIAMYGSNNKVVQNYIHNNGYVNGGQGIFSGSGTNGNVYDGNYIISSGKGIGLTNLDHGMYLCGNDETVINNIIAYNSDYGIHWAAYSDITSGKILNNTIAFNGRSGLVFWDGYNSSSTNFSNIQVKNNIFYKNHDNGIGFYSARGNTITFDTNLFYGNTYGNYCLPGESCSAGSIATYTRIKDLSVNPNFAYDPGLSGPSTYPTQDYRLTSNSTAALNTGLALAGVTSDFDGTSRPQGSAFDIGAYEFKSAVASRPMAPANLRVQ